MELEHSPGWHGRYLSGGNHSARLLVALTAFHRALTRRWREEVCEAVVDNHATIRTGIRRPDAPTTVPGIELWDYGSTPARYHLESGDCAFVNWVRGGQPGELRAIRCEGLTHASHVPGAMEGDGLPASIPCGLGAILAQVENWAWAERNHVFAQVPLFDHHDLSALGRAHDAFIRIGGLLGLEKAAGSSTDAGSGLAPLTDRLIPGAVSNIAAQDAEGQDWWAGWTGLAASRAKSGFFASVAPSLNNQSRIAGSLANLYADRAAIIVKGRTDALYWIQWATKSLDQTEMIDDPVTGWRVVQGIGTGVSISGGWSGVGAAVGATIVLMGFIGENIDAAVQTEEYGHGIDEVVGRLDEEITALNRAIDQYERDLNRAVFRLENAIHEVHSFNLELYDLTENDPEGDREQCEEGYVADVSKILRVAEECYKAGEAYETLLPIIAGTSEADSHLADKDGQQTAADKDLLGVRDQLEHYLRTTCGRYLIAGDQVKHAATAYAEDEDTQRHRFERTMEDWAARDIGDVDVAFDPGQYAGATDRSEFDPYEENPVRAGSEAGAADPDNDEYVTVSEE